MKGFLKVVAAFLVALVLLPILLYGGCKLRQSAKLKQMLKSQEKKAEQEFAPALTKIEDAIAAAKKEKKPYDLDRTIRVIHEIDQALKNRGNFREYMAEVARQDFRDVAPDVLAARKGILAVLQDVYAKQIELENQEDAWSITSQFLVSSIASVNLSLDAGLSGSVGVDRGLIESYLAELKAQNEKKEELIKGIEKEENRLIEAMGSYAEVYHRYVAEWDKLCGLRDHAYLAANNGDWDTAIASARQAIEQAPQEKEAHLLLTMAVLRQMDELESPATSRESGEFQQVLGDYERQHPGSTAPAHLLRANFFRLVGDEVKARNHYDHAAAYFPKQADELADMLNPYRFRAFLRKSREGNHIVRQYESTMLGGGYFSPDLQTADMLYQRGRVDEADRKVLDHFARRRIQGEWDFVISDIRFCQEIMGADFERIFPPDNWLDLEVEMPTVGSRYLRVAVNNRSDRPIRNATLVMCINFSDMYPDDYRTYVAGETVPVLPPGEVTKFGKLKVDTEIFEREKTAADIVAARAILISNDAVTWVDTDAYRITELTRRLRERPEVPVSEPVPAKRRRAPLADAETRKLLTDAAFKIASDIGKDHLDVELPGKLAVLSPFFRLLVDGEEKTPDVNIMENGEIRLRFKDVTDKGKAGKFGFKIYSPWGEYEHDLTQRAGELKGRLQDD